MIIKIRNKSFEPVMEKHISTKKTETYLVHLKLYCQFIYFIIILDLYI